MQRTTKDDLKQHLRTLGLRTGDNVWVQSRLLAFGLLEGGVEAAYAALREVVGEDGTIVVPTYRLSAPADEPYDPATSPSIDMGALSEFVRQLPAAVRSLCPMHSHAAIGPLAEALKQPDGTCSMGPGSDFEILHSLGFKNLYLGIADHFHDAATFPVHVQAMHGNIPYRRWLELPRVVMRDGKPQPMRVRYYGRIDRNAKEDLSLARNLLERANRITLAPCPYGESCCMDLAAYFDVIMQALRQDPLVLLARGQEREAP